jgi:hypothetical protein
VECFHKNARMIVMEEVFAYRTCNAFVLMVTQVMTVGSVQQIKAGS